MQINKFVYLLGNKDSFDGFISPCSHKVLSVVSFDVMPLNLLELSSYDALVSKMNNPQ